MPFEICAKRQAVIESEGHVLVLGGPGAGKTTLALLKAKPLIATLKPVRTRPGRVYGGFLPSHPNTRCHSRRLAAGPSRAV